MKQPINWFYIFIGLLFAAMLLLSARYFQGRGEASIGVARSQSFRISSEKPAMVNTVRVVPGMQVHKGDLLVELTSQALEIELAKLTNRIAMLKSERAERDKLAQAEISYIKAQKGIEIEELDGQINQMSAELKMTEELSRDYTPGTSISQESPLGMRMKSLKLQRERHLEAQEIKIRDILQVTATENQLQDNQITLLESERIMLEEEKANLMKYAPADGVVKSVDVKTGEQVAAYTPLLEIIPLRPTMVTLYLIGKNTSSYPIGKAVEVTPFDRFRGGVQGVVIGYGSVSVLPEILQKSTATRAFGQEVFIEVPADNSLANGEKVVIR
jgi:multidrug resistance efflux pump